ncbi:hypothetical protein L2E82_44898 [Cichorium intybus]|uniref:Uncharacterized protein n=1 Tax=Cichorium intybus TaxID=13427 RepID=A0ACB8ZS20_CICIN|nr:hypothetical protein L2E82_44898 [Cichorium intybus]
MRCLRYHSNDGCLLSLPYSPRPSPPSTQPEVAMWVCDHKRQLKSVSPQVAILIFTALEICLISQILYHEHE